MIRLRQHKDTKLSKQEITNHEDVDQLKADLIDLCCKNDINANEVEIKKLKENNGDYTHEVFINHRVRFCSFKSLYGYAQIIEPRKEKQG